MTGSEVRRAALALPVLAVGFAGVFDIVILATGWQQLKRGAIILARDAAESDEAGGMEAALDRAAEPGVEVRVLRLAPDGAVWRQWRRGPSDTLASEPLPAGCLYGAYIADMTLSLPEWLMLAPVARAVVPTLRASASVCLAKGAGDESPVGPGGHAPGLPFLSR